MAQPIEIDHAIGGKRSADRVDRVIAGLAAAQHGVVGRRQLVSLGVGARAIEHRLERGRLLPLHRGVYAVGHALVTRSGRWMAAVLAAGPRAVLSHRDAGALHGLRPSAGAGIEVTAPCGRRRPGIDIHRVDLPDDEITVVDSIPVTTPARTLLDLAGFLPPAQLERALERAEALRLADRTPLGALLTRYPRCPGRRALRAALAKGVQPDRTRSELEAAFLSFLDAHGLPRPVVNGIVEGYEVDFHWPGQRLIVELDGRETHATTAAFERDRARDRKLIAAGWRTVRITWRQLHDDARELAGDLAAVLRLSPPARPAPRPATP